MKITTLEMANVKRVKALRLTPTKNGLTIVGGKNGQGKTSVLDAIAYALGGERYAPSQLKRKDAVGDTFIHIETDDGLIIDRKGANASLTVVDANGKKCGQALLDAVIAKLALDLPKFVNASASEKAKTLLDTLGIGEVLTQLEKEERAKYDQRTAVGRMRDQKKKTVNEMLWYENAPEEEMSVSDLITEQQGILARNGIRERARLTIKQNIDKKEMARNRIIELQDLIKKLDEEIELAKKDDGEFEDVSDIKKKIAEFESINEKIRVNKMRNEKQAEAIALDEEYNTLSDEIAEIRKKRIALINGANLPLDGLSVEDGELIYKGAKWDCMSGAQQLIVACAIASSIKPDCKFVLLDKLEQLDLDTLEEFNNWLIAHDLQCIATRVSTGGECSIIIDDGEVVAQSTNPLADDEY